MLFDNTEKPLPLPGNVSMREYATVFTGDLTRWETAGALLAAVSLHKGTKELSKRNATEELSKVPSWRAIIDATQACLTFCDDLGSLNDVIMWILAEHTIVHTLFYGDASCESPFN